MAASKYDFAIEQGTSFRFSLVYKDSTGTPIDITGWCSRLILKTNIDTTQIYTTNNTDYNLYKFTIDEPNGKLTLLLPATTTNDFTFHNAKYDLELQSPDEIYSGGGKYITRILFGTITILKRFSQVETALECNI